MATARIDTAQAVRELEASLSTGPPAPRSGPSGAPSGPPPTRSPPRPSLARRPRRPRLLPGPGPDRALAPGAGNGGRDPVGRGAVPQRGEGGKRAGPGRGLALVEPAPAPHLIDAGRCLVGLTVPEGRRLRVVALPLPALAGAWSGGVVVETGEAPAHPMRPRPSSRAPRRARSLMGHNYGCSAKPSPTTSARIPQATRASGTARRIATAAPGRAPQEGLDLTSRPAMVSTGVVANAVLLAPRSAPPGGGGQERGPRMSRTWGCSSSQRVTTRERWMATWSGRTAMAGRDRRPAPALGAGGSRRWWPGR